MTDAGATNEAEAVRSRLYLLLGALLGRPPDDRMLDLVRSLDAGVSRAGVGGALSDLAAAAADTRAGDAAAGYQALFIGVGRGELVPYASWYRTGFVGEWPLARLREDMARLGISRADGAREPEDHIAALCEMMSGLVSGAFGDGIGREQAVFFAAHVAPWAPYFFDDLARTETSTFYAAVGAVGRSFLDIETDLMLEQAASSP